MLATPLSKRPYYPYLLANGNDAVLINYSGAMISGVTDHIHAEQNQGTLCAWYKLEHRKLGAYIAPIITSCYQVIIDGEICDPKWFEQSFDSRRAVLKSLVRFRCGVEVAVETFLTDSGVLASEIEVLNSEAENFSIEFALPIWLRTETPLVEKPEIVCKAVGNAVEFTYKFSKSGFSGKGQLCSDRNDCIIVEKKLRPVLQFNSVKQGWRGTMFTLCADSPNELPKLSEDLKQQHYAAWEKYFSASEIRLPDDELNYSYELSRYIARAAQHSGGAIVCGLLPHMWAGGTVCPCDAEFVFLGLLQSNNVTEARKFLQFYLDQYEDGEKIIRDLGLKGVAFSNWGNVRGEHCSPGDLGHDISHRKPVMIAIIGIAAGEYLSYADPEDDEVKKLLHGCAEFISCFVREDGSIRSCAAQNESDIDVERDSFMLAVSLRVLEFDKIFNKIPERGKNIKLLECELEKNRDAKGVILPWKEAKYYSPMPLWSQHYWPGIHNTEQLDVFRKDCTTPWGTDGDQPSEVARHWSWDNPIFAREYIRNNAPKKAFPLLKDWFKYAASSGAVPEKIRIDGYVIGYWYPTPYGAFLQAISEAFGRIEDDKLYLLWGFDGSWKNFSAKRLRLSGGWLLTVEVEEGEIKKLFLEGKKLAEREFEVILNPVYGEWNNGRIGTVLI